MHKWLLVLNPVVAVLLVGCARPWSAVMRFEGGTANPQIPFVVKVRSAEGLLLYDAVLENRCVQLSVEHPPGNEVVIEVQEMTGAHVGGVRVALGDRQLRYIPVNGQLGILTVQAGKTCR